MQAQERSPRIDVGPAQIVGQNFSLAESARLMPVMHRPLLARAPKPVRSPENRWPRGSEVVVSRFIPVGEFPPRSGQGLPVFPMQGDPHV